jgi:hypothetical protein
MQASNAIDYAKFRSRSDDAVIRVYDAAGNVIETHEQAGELKEWGKSLFADLFPLRSCHLLFS